MKVKIFFTLFFIMSCFSNAFSQSAAKTVASFYKFHLSNPTIFSRKELDSRKNWFSGELYRLFLNELKVEEEFLKQNPSDKPFFGDGFPFQPYEECYVDGKNYPNLYKVGKAKKHGDKKIVEVKFYTSQECGNEFIKTYKIELVKADGRWLINDSLYSDGGRLSETLKRTKY